MLLPFVLMWQLSIPSEPPIRVKDVYERGVLTDFAPFSASSVTPATFCDAIISDSGTAILLEGAELARWNLRTRRKEASLLPDVKARLDEDSGRIRMVRLIPERGGERLAMSVSSGVAVVLPARSWAAHPNIDASTIRLDAYIQSVVFLGENRLLVLCTDYEGSDLPHIFVYRLSESGLDLEFQTKSSFHVESVVWDSNEAKCYIVRRARFASQSMVTTHYYELQLDSRRMKRAGTMACPNFTAGSMLSPIRLGDYCVGQFWPSPGVWLKDGESREFLSVPFLPSLYSPLYPTDRALTNALWSPNGEYVVADMGPSWNGCLVVVPTNDPADYYVIKKPRQETAEVSEYVAAISNDASFVLCFEVDSRDGERKQFRWILYERKANSALNRYR